jgi:2-phosphoglycolate phosphatase
MTYSLVLPLPQAVLFDLDGTLADTALDLMGVVQRLRGSCGLGPISEELLRPHVSAGASALLHAGMNIHPDDEGSGKWRETFLDSYAEHIADRTCLFDGISPLLTKLQHVGISWGIVTNKPRRFTDRLVRLIGLERAGSIISGDTTAHPKPHPLPLLTAAREMKVEPGACWYVGDDQRDIQAGKAAGMATIAAGWGYARLGEPEQWGADVVAATPADLQELLLSVLAHHEAERTEQCAA